MFYRRLFSHLVDNLFLCSIMQEFIFLAFIFSLPSILVPDQAQETCRVPTSQPRPPSRSSSWSSSPPHRQHRSRPQAPRRFQALYYRFIWKNRPVASNIQEWSMVLYQDIKQNIEEKNCKEIIKNIKQSKGKPNKRIRGLFL